MRPARQDIKGTVLDIKGTVLLMYFWSGFMCDFGIMAWGLG